MVSTHSLGFPRIGAKRELKFVLESYWKGEISKEELITQGALLRQRHWKDQDSLTWAPIGDFAFYDQVLDMSFTLGNLPERVKDFHGDTLDNYFRVARGRSVASSDDHAQCCGGVAAGEMTKWFDTNYHYIVPEFTAITEFKLDPSRLLDQLAEAKKQGINAKPVIIGPVTYLWLGKAKIKILLATYFGTLEDNRYLACNLPVDGLHIDAINAKEEIPLILNLLPTQKVLSLGVINGRNIWKTDLNKTLDWLEPIAQKLADKLWIAPSCSLLHSPVDLDSEQKLDKQIQNWLAFSVQKLAELEVLAKALNTGRQSVSEQLALNQSAIEARRNSLLVNNPLVKDALSKIKPQLGKRDSHYEVRAAKQAAILKLPKYPTTTIGSFPQTHEIRQARSQYKAGELNNADYRKAMEHEITRSINEQENLGLDVLVHGEAERNDMVEYFGEQLDGYAFSQFGWVQSYGSRCVKPPILFGDISRSKAMTVDWIVYAQSLTKKPMKGMLTGPVTILNWSFVRDDQPRSVSCYQLALAIRDEVLDLEKVGIKVIQIDEAALREGLPLRKSQWKHYLDWAVESFRITANGVKDETQVHTHMCYSEFNDIIEAIAQMDADVITIETSRSDMELLDVFDSFKYPNEIGPGVYDIHSPNIPTKDQIVSLMQKAAERIPAERLWVNPDCGLKTRQWPEVIPALRNMVEAAKQLRAQA